MATESYTYYYTGGVQTHEIPAGVTSVSFKMDGAGGGDGRGQTDWKPGGDGAYLEVNDYPVQWGDTLYLFVGEAGHNGATNGAWPNGGGGGDVTHPKNIDFTATGGEGGGESSVRLNGTSYSDRIAVAGGGGGGPAIGGQNQWRGMSDGADDSTDSQGASSSTYFGVDGADTDVSGTVGGDGTTDYDSSHGKKYVAAGGGGGGGLQAGEGGHGGCRSFEPEVAASGGAGGMTWHDGNAASTSHSIGGGGSNDGRIVIEYERPGALYYDGSNWVSGATLVYDGTSWNSAATLGYDGSNWN